MNAPISKRRRWPKILAAFLLLVSAGTIYVWSNPLIFNESFWQHAHCIKQAGMLFQSYADQNGGRFPADPRGYGCALLQFDPDCYYTLTSSGYDESAYHAAKQQGTPLAEKDCGRVYIQGLNKFVNPKIAILIDKKSTPGGDHCHLLARMTAPLGREVAYVDGSSDFISDKDWPAFVQSQLLLLATTSIPPAEAQRLYDSAMP